jgi:putative DNA primase/helicase
MPRDAATAAELDALRGGKLISVPDNVAPTEDAVALAFAQTYAGQLVFDHTADNWFIWRDGRWSRDDRDSVFDTGRSFTRAVRAKLSDPPAALAKVAFASAVERAAKTDPKLAVSHEIWDCNPWLLGTPAGVVDLKTGETLDAAPDLYISRTTAVAPATPNTATPIWSRFLRDATNGDADLQRFLQRLAGYALTGCVNEEVLTFLYGPGGNGKGVFIRVLNAILGDYAVAAPIEVFTAGSRINLEYYRASLPGVRLVTASETEAQATWAESQIKEMTGFEAPLSARHPYGRPFTFFPQFKLVLVGNFAPKLKGRSPSMERRLRVVPFNHVPQNPDRDLKKKLEAEYPAILRWMIDGCLAWQKDGLGTAAAITAATSTYFEQQDAFRRFVDEMCILDKGLSLKPGILLTSFNNWAKANGEEAVGSNAFAELTDRFPGLAREKSNGVRLVRGIGLKAPWREDDRDDPGRHF